MNNINVPTDIKTRMSYATPIKVSILVCWKGFSCKSYITACSMSDIEREITNMTNKKPDGYKVFVGY